MLSFHVFLSDDLTKEAFIHWTDSSGKRHHKKGGINRLKTVEDRRAAALALIAKMEAEYVPPSPVAKMMLDWVVECGYIWRKKTFRTIKSKVDCFLQLMKGKTPTNALVKAFFIVVQNDGGQLFMLAAVVTICAAALLWMERKAVTAFLKTRKI